jgi:hypothetical protein
MPFTIKAPADEPGVEPFAIQANTKADAIRAAVTLIGDNIRGVTITDEDGEVFDPDGFSRFFNKTRAAP